METTQKDLFARLPSKEKDEVYLIYGYMPPEVLNAWAKEGIFPPKSDEYEIAKEEKTGVKA